MRHTACWTKDYPRPQFVRKEWQNLNGEWEFAFDKSREGLKKEYNRNFDFQTKIQVPFSYETEMSEIGEETLCKCVWYQRKITIHPQNGKRILLHFEGSDYQTDVWLNGKHCGSDTGAYHRLTFDITECAEEGNNLLTVRCLDDYSTEKPRGKQRAKDHSYQCWYIDTVGIYKTVWLETVDEKHIETIKITPVLSQSSIKIKFTFSEKVTEGMSVQTEVLYQGEPVAKEIATVNGTVCEQTISLSLPLHLWKVGAPNLYDVRFTLINGDAICDEVASYFGMREISIEGNQILLNGQPLYQKLILDQGYWRRSGLTPPSEEHLARDITDMMRMGFNGARKHQKIEDERFLYYADILGYIVWAEMPSAYTFSEKSSSALLHEWLLAVCQQYNHPCILCWVPFNESWGIRQIGEDREQQNFVNSVYYATKSVDAMRPVITNDGWEHTISDILTIHHYEQNGDNLNSYFNTVEKCATKIERNPRRVFCEGYGYRGQPIIISEFGGISFSRDNENENWGYGQGVPDETAFLNRFEKLINGLTRIEFLSGFCYTQLSDVYQEVNGLLDFDRNAKVAFEKVREILDWNTNKFNLDSML